MKKQNKRGKREKKVETNGSTGGKKISGNRPITLKHLEERRKQQKRQKYKEMCGIST